jgi:hypothetical protein
MLASLESAEVSSDFARELEQRIPTSTLEP